MAGDHTQVVADQLLSWSQLASALVPAVLIAFATFGASWWATRQAHQLDRRRREEREAAEALRLLRSLRIELLVAWDRYQDEVGEEVENNGSDKRLTKRYRIDHSPFPVYENSAERLGTLQNEALVEAIVTAHAEFRSLLAAHARVFEIQHTALSGEQSNRAQARRNWAVGEASNEVVQLHAQAKNSVRKAVIAIEQALPETIDSDRTERVFRNRQQIPDTEPGAGDQ